MCVWVWSWSLVNEEGPGPLGALARRTKKFVLMNSYFLINPAYFEIIKQINFCVISYYENCQDDFCNAWFCRPLGSPAHSYLSRIERRKISIGFILIRYEVHLNCRNIQIFSHIYAHWIPIYMPQIGRYPVSYKSFMESYVYWTVHHCDSWRIKDQLDVTCYFISRLMCSTCFGH